MPPQRLDGRVDESEEPVDDLELGDAGADDGGAGDSDASPPSGPHDGAGAAGTAADGTKFKRAYKACLNCRRRKIRCIFEDTDPPATSCKRCKRENRQCVVPLTSKRGGIRNVLAGKARKAREEMLREQLASRGSDVWRQRELFNSADALHLLSQLARSMPRQDDGAGSGGSAANSAPGTPGSSAIVGVNNRGLAAAAATASAGGAGALTSLLGPFPLGNTVPLSETEIVRDLHILTVEEARLLVRYFFDHMEPYYPFVPAEYSSADNIAAMPLLLATITCLAVRYYEAVPGATPAEFALYERRAAAHVALWEYCQRLMSLTVWTEASSHSVTTVIAFLLFTEWNPTAVHLRHRDYANQGIAGSDFNKSEDWLGIGASRRSDRMSWLMLGQAARLAQDIGLMESSPTLYLAIHTSEIVLACRLGRAPMLSKLVHDSLPPGLPFTREQVAQLEVLRIMSLANELLYSSREVTRELVKTGRYIFLLNILVPHLDEWQIKYKDMLEGDSVFNEDIVFGFNHSRLYVLSLSLMPTSSATTIQNLAVLRPATKFTAAAVDAAKNVVNAARRMHKRGALRFMPIRWVMRLIHAIVFLVKSLLLTPPVFQPDTPKSILTLIRESSQMLLEVGPDRYHICRHYGTVLLNLCAQFSRDTQSPMSSRPGSRLPSAPGSAAASRASSPRREHSRGPPSGAPQVAASHVPPLSRGRANNQGPAPSGPGPLGTAPLAHPAGVDAKAESEGPSPAYSNGSSFEQNSPFSRANPVPHFATPDGPLLASLEDTMTFGLDIDFLAAPDSFLQNSIWDAAVFDEQQEM